MDSMPKRVESWVVTDEFWQRVQPLIPARSVRDKVYVRKPGVGRPAKPARLVFEAIVFVLRTGCQWKALPKERFGSASAVHKRFLEWEAAGFFVSLRKAGLDSHAALLQRPACLGKWLLAQLVPLKQMPELEQGGGIGHRLALQINAHKAPQTRTVV